jgi:wobble nucleotide-excising tRNase
MITKLVKLKKFGIYKDFSWNESLGKFKKKNLIYGWNYSGKTTLSKLFQTLEFKGSKQYFSNPEFSFEYSTTNSSPIGTFTNNNFKETPYFFKVFNSQYIKDVFISDDMDLDFQPISFYLGDESGVLDKQKKKLTSYNEILATRINNLKNNFIDEFEKYDKKTGSKFSDKAKEIRDNYLDGKLNRDEFNISHFRIIAEQVKVNLSSFILANDERDKTKIDATATKNYEKQKDDYTIDESLQTISKQVTSILEDTAPKSIPFPELDDDTTLFQWVQAGIKLHDNEYNCKFCTKELPKNRIEDLNSYYSKKLQEIQSLIEFTTNNINSEREKIKIKFSDKKSLGDNYQNDYIIALKAFEEISKQYSAQLKVLDEDLKRKHSSYFNAISASPIIITELDGTLQKVNDAVKKHNAWLEAFDDNKRKALDKLILHYVAEFLVSESYIAKENNKQRASGLISNLEAIIQKNDKAIIELEAKLKSLVKGQKELNDTLSILLHRDDVKIEINDGKFTLDRSGYPASNLSEGEKSAIAFAYFLTELKSLRTEEPSLLPQTIIFIDDPISSLDSNHIFQVRSLIQDFFKENDYAQIFISTHNFEFFSVMRDSKLFNNVRGSAKENDRPFFWIRRQDSNESVIEKLPKTFSEYKSEYAALFHLLKDYRENPSKKDFQYAVLLPNAVRRFVELYTAMKYPSNNEAVDARAKIVFEDNSKTAHGIKLLHWFSHQEQFEKVQQHDDKLLQIDDVIDDLLNFIEKEDSLHWLGINN